MAMRTQIMLIHACLLLLLSFPVYAQKTVTKYHYWFDQARQKEVMASYGSADELQLQLSTDGLIEGIHQLYMRFQDSDGAWSSPQGTMVFVKALPKNGEVKAVKAEYWIDNGNRQEISISGDRVNFTVDANNMSEGLHTLNYRVKDSESVYSPLQTWLFVRNTLSNSQTGYAVNTVEYWFDDDLKSKKNQSVTGSEVSFSVDASSLKDGFHRLSFRTKNALDFFGATEIWLFYKDTAPKASKITWYRYWWNKHTEKSVKETVNNGGGEFSFTKELTVPDYARNDGFSALSTARFQIVFGDDAGGVSTVEYVDVEYPDVYAPVSKIEADKTETTGSVTLTWSLVKPDQLQDYNVYYAEPGQPFVLWLPNTTKTTATFNGQAGKTYRFTVTARDKAGNREALDENKNVMVKFINAN